MDDIQKVNAEKAGGAAMGSQQAPMQANQGQLGMGGQTQPMQANAPTSIQGMPGQMGTGQLGQGGPMAGQQGGSIQSLVTDYQQAKGSGAQLQSTTEQAVQQTLLGSGINPQQVLGQGQNGQQDPTGSMMKQLDGMMQQMNNYTGNPYQQKF
jgi:hypothetical protein